MKENNMSSEPDYEVISKKWYFWIPLAFEVNIDLPLYLTVMLYSYRL